MKSQQELKWHQKPKGVIILLIFFFPAGLYLMWKNELWTKQTRWIVTGIIAVLILANASKNNKTLLGKWHTEISNEDIGSSSKNIYDLELTNDSLFILNENLFGGETKETTKGKFTCEKIDEELIGITFIHTYVEKPGFTASDLGISNPKVMPGDEIREYLFWNKSKNILIPMPPSDLEKSMGRLSSYRPLINEEKFEFSK